MIEIIYRSQMKIRVHDCPREALLYTARIVRIWNPYLTCETWQISENIASI